MFFHLNWYLFIYLFFKFYSKKKYPLICSGFIFLSLELHLIIYQIFGLVTGYKRGTGEGQSGRTGARYGTGLNPLSLNIKKEKMGVISPLSEVCSPCWRQWQSGIYRAQRPNRCVANCSTHPLQGQVWTHETSTRGQYST